MKSNKLILSLSLVFTVLFSILFQSLHTYEHISKQLSEKHCEHQYNVSGTEITHEHHNIDHCYVCHFTLGSYITPTNLSYQLYSSNAEIPYFSIDQKIVITFSGSSYSLRGPPINTLS